MIEYSDESVPMKKAKAFLLVPRVLRKRLVEIVIFEQIAARDKRAGQMGIWSRGIASRAKSKCKGPKADAYFA